MEGVLEDIQINHLHYYKFGPIIFVGVYQLFSRYKSLPLKILKVL